MWHFRFGLYSSELRGIGVAAMTPIADQHASAGATKPAWMFPMISGNQRMDMDGKNPEIPSLDVSDTPNLANTRDQTSTIPRLKWPLWGTLTPGAVWRYSPASTT